MSEDNGQVIDVGNKEVAKREDVLPIDINKRIEEAKRQNNALMSLMKELLEEGVDYGTEKGIPKPFLHQPGAQQLGLVFKFRPEFEILNTVTDFNQDPVYVSYEVKCRLYQRDTGTLLGEGVGSCNNYEEKYKYRWKKDEHGKKYREIYEDPLNQQNTLLKMAKKRSHVDATLNVTGASRLFTQDADLVYSSNEQSSQKDVPPEETVIPFGKHEGQKLKDIPSGYLKWMVKQSFVDDNLKKKAEKVIAGKSSNKKSKEKSLSDRQKEVAMLVKKDKGLEKDVMDFLGNCGVETVDELEEDSYQKLLNVIKMFSKEPEINPTDEELGLE